MLDKNKVLMHYKRGDIQAEMVLHGQNKEVVGSFKGESYAKRPDIISYPRDVLELVKQGITSLHASEELWSNPLQLDPLLKRNEVEELRIGWDLIIDIDCPYFPYSKIAADLIIKALQHHEVKSISIKFSGNKGFHIGVPFEAFPNSIAGEKVSKRFPDATRDIAFYLKDMVKEIFASKLLDIEKGDVGKIASNLKKEVKEILQGNKLNSDIVLDIDTVLISPRHLYRMPYSLHEKSGLCSIPLALNEIMDFERAKAEPSLVKVRPEIRFLDREKVVPQEAKSLFDKAIAAGISKKEIQDFKQTERKEMQIPETAIPEIFFPPCIKLILQGMQDGKKRSIFILINFFRSVGWSYDQIEARLKEWNTKNPEPLREVTLIGQLRYHKQHKKNVLPPNCKNQMYYLDFGVCKPDHLCKRIKNPVQYAKRRVFYLNQNKKNKPEKKEELSKSEKS